MKPKKGNSSIMKDNRFAGGGGNFADEEKDEISYEDDLKLKLKMKVKRTINDSHPIFNRMVIKKMRDNEKELKKKKKKDEYSDDENDKSNSRSQSRSSINSDTSIKPKQQKKQKDGDLLPSISQESFNENQSEEEKNSEDGLPKRFKRNPLKIFQNHKMPKIKPNSPEIERYYSRNIEVLRYPLYPNSYKKGDVRLDDRIEPYLRHHLFDYNQIVKREEKYQFISKIIAFILFYYFQKRKKYTTEKHEENKRIVAQQKYEYKVRIDELDERNRLEALQQQASIPQYGIQPQYNLHSFKNYPPVYSYDQGQQAFLPSSLISQSAIYNNSKPRFLPLIPLSFNQQFY